MEWHSRLVKNVLRSELREVGGTAGLVLWLTGIRHGRGTGNALDSLGWVDRTEERNSLGESVELVEC